LLSAHVIYIENLNGNMYWDLYFSKLYIFLYNLNSVIQLFDILENRIYKILVVLYKRYIFKKEQRNPIYYIRKYLSILIMKIILIPELNNLFLYFI